MRLSVIPLLAALVLLVGCGDDDGGGSGADLTALATTTHVADLAANVGGDRVEVRGLVKANSDPHDYEPRPSDARAAAEADLALRSGGDIDEWLDDVLENAPEGIPTVTLLDSVETIEGGHAHEDEHAEEEDEHAEEEGETDPHWWQDPRNGVLAVEAIRDALVEVDPEGREVYERNARTYIGQLEALDRSIAGCIAQVPAAQRKLITTHDAFGYYAERYDIDVVGALIPSLSTQAQPSAKDTLALVEQIEEEGARAIFPESALNPKLEEAVARESGAEVGEALWADSLGPEGSDGDTYLKALASDTADLVEGLSGGQVRCTPDTRRAG